MTNKINLLWILPALTFFLAFTSLFSDSNYKNKIIIEINSDDDYEKAWRKVDSLQNKGLTRSAFEVVEQIYEAARADGNQPQIIKSFIYKLRFTNFTEEDSHKKIVNQIKDEIKNAPFPSDAILNSVLAQVYWQYYSNNRYRFQNRTETVNFDNEDFQTWDLARLIREIVKHYHISLENDSDLKKIPITDFKEIIVSYNSEQAYLRSTLYDLLAHNALSFYINDEASLTDPVYKFELKDAGDFSSSEKFININFDTRDSLSLKFYAVQLFQDVIEFHLNDENKDAFIDIDLMRMNFIRSSSVHPQKDSLYLIAITEMEKRFEEVPYSSLISYNKAKYFYDEGKKYNPAVSDLHKWELRKAMEICEDAIEKFPETYGASCCKWLKNQILLKNLTIQTEYGNIIDKPFRAIVSYQNTNKIFVRIIPWNDSKEKSTPKDNHQKMIEYYTSQEPIKEWSVNLPDDSDYQNHSVEIKIPELNAGQYMILVGSDKNFSYSKNAIVFGRTWVSNLSYIRREKTNDKIEIYVLHRETGQPLKEVKVEIYKRIYSPDYREYIYEKLTSGYTNSNGDFEFERDKSSYETYKIVLKRGNDRFESQDYYSYNYNPGYGKTTSTFLFPDRAIYRPGQTIYFKGLVIDPDGKKEYRVLTDRQTTITFNDANHQKISDITLTTNEYGTFNGSFVIPYGKIGGQYYISNGSGIKYFRVEEYKRPKFEVKFDPIKGSYSLNDKVTTTGFAKTYSGANLNDVQVKYRVVRRATFPYFYYWCIRYYNWYNQNQMEITNGVTTTNKDGKFKIEFDLVPDLSIIKESNPVFNYTIIADVVDVTGETHSSQTNVSAGYIALLSNINLPEVINRDSSDKYLVSTTNLNQQFESANVSITVHKLKTPERIFRKRLWGIPDKFLSSKDEFYHAFEHDIYKDENEFYNWEKAEKVFETSFRTTDSSLLSFNNLKDWEPGKYYLLLKTKDKNGTPVEFEKYFTLFEPQADKISLNDACWVYMNEKAYEPGETVKLYIGSAVKNVKALYELEQDEKLIVKKWITLNNEQKEIKVPITEEHRGNIIVHITFTVNNENHSVTKVISVPWTNKQLHISFETFRNKLLPGSKEEWKLKIKDPEGRFASAEFLASMYHASLDVFAPNYWSFITTPD
jgi:5-hydroxyisourate hydrolase-like protein (transthyretin family)